MTWTGPMGAGMSHSGPIQRRELPGLPRSMPGACLGVLPEPWGGMREMATGGPQGELWGIHGNRVPILVGLTTSPWVMTPRQAPWPLLALSWHATLQQYCCLPLPIC